MYPHSSAQAHGETASPLASQTGMGVPLENPAFLAHSL